MLYDVLIIGGGSAGMTAGIYASRARLNTLMIEKAFPGGQLMMCENIENYPGFAEGICGMDLSNAMRAQADKFGLQHKTAEIARVDLIGLEKTAVTTEGEEIRAKTVILALGARPRQLKVPGESEFMGRGVSYCAVCDGAFFQGKKIFVIGGGDTAVEDGIFLTRYSDDVTIVHRRDQLRAQKIIQERAFANDKITVIWDSVVESISGNDSVEKIKLRNVKTAEVTEHTTDAVFVLVGTDPNTKFLKGQIEMDESGYIHTDQEMQTNIPGVFAAGDTRHKLLKQVVTACAEGAIAATAAEKHIEGLVPA